MRHSLKTLVLASIAVLAIAGCGVEEDHHPAPPATTDDGGTDPSDAGPSLPSTNVDPLVSLSARTLSLSTRFVGDATEAELRGTLPGITWTNGTAIGAPASGFFAGQTVASTAVGTFDLSYVKLPNTWADYGTEANLKAMTADGRSFVSCNWFDGTAKVAVPSGTDAECHLKVAIAADGTVTGAGNMRSFQ